MLVRRLWRRKNGSEAIRFLENIKPFRLVDANPFNGSHVHFTGNHSQSLKLFLLLKMVLCNGRILFYWKICFFVNAFLSMNRRSHQRYSIKKVFAQTLQNSQEKKLHQSLVFSNVTDLRLEAPAQVFSCEFFEIFTNVFFYGTPPVAASEWNSFFLEENVEFSIIHSKFQKKYIFNGSGFFNGTRLF